MLDYQEEFEIAKARVNCDELFAVEMFIGGLKEEIQHTLIKLNPQTLSQAFHAARIEEAYFNMIMRKAKPTHAITWHKNTPTTVVEPKSPPWVSRSAPPYCKKWL